VVTGGGGSFVVQHLVAGNAWQLLPPASVPPQDRHPQIAAAPDGAPVLAWVNPATNVVGTGRWTGQLWDTRGYAFGMNAADEAPQLVVDRQGTAWVGWKDSGQFNLWMSNY